MSQEHSGPPPHVPIVTNTQWNTPNNTVSLDPLPVLVSSPVLSPNSGGTKGILDEIRQCGSFSVPLMTQFLDGGAKASLRRKYITSPTRSRDFLHKHTLSRPEALAEHIRVFNAIHDKYVVSMIPTKQDTSWMMQHAANSGTLANHWGLGVSTILSSANEDQQAEWLPPAMMMKMTVAYAQTELGKGSNVKGLQTLAFYDHTNQTFLIHTPHIGAYKWWPGTLGKVATHAIIYAQLIIDKTEYGVHAFMVQIRDDQHRPLPGIIVGSNGNSIGDYSNDCGFLRLDRVIVPHFSMLSRYQHIDTETGKYTLSPEKKVNKQLHYLTMLMTRGGMVAKAFGLLGKGLSIALRYSYIRKQGAMDSHTVQQTYNAIQWAITGHNNNTSLSYIQPQPHIYSSLSQWSSLTPLQQRIIFLSNTFTRLPLTAFAHLRRQYYTRSPHDQNSPLTLASILSNPDSIGYVPGIQNTSSQSSSGQSTVQPLSQLQPIHWSFDAPEYPIIEYQIQHGRILDHLAFSILLKVTGQWMMDQLTDLEEDKNNNDTAQTSAVTETTSSVSSSSGTGNTVNLATVPGSGGLNLSLLSEIAPTTAGLKAICTATVYNALEDLRRSCGGNGYLKHAGIGPLLLDHVWEVTAEGEEKVMILQTGKHIMKHLLSQHRSIESENGQLRHNNTHTSTGFTYLSVLLLPHTSTPVLLPSSSSSHSNVSLHKDSVSSARSHLDYLSKIDTMTLMESVGLVTFIHSPNIIHLFSSHHLSDNTTSQLDPLVNMFSSMDRSHSMILFLEALFRFKTLLSWKQSLITVLQSIIQYNTILNRVDSYDLSLNSSAIIISQSVDLYCKNFMFTLACQKVLSISSPPKSTDGNVADNTDYSSLFYPLFNCLMIYACGDIVKNSSWLPVFVCPQSSPESSVPLSSNLVSSLQALYTLSLNRIVTADALLLVDSFDFSDSVLCSSLGRYDGAVYESLIDNALLADFNQQDPYWGYNTVHRPRVNVEWLQEGTQEHIAMRTKALESVGVEVKPRNTAEKPVQTTSSCPFMSGAVSNMSSSMLPLDQQVAIESAKIHANMGEANRSIDCPVRKKKAVSNVKEVRSSVTSTQASGKIHPVTYHSKNHCLGVFNIVDHQPALL